MTIQQEKAEKFAELHARDQAFIIPNPWDVGTSRILAHVGFEALATTGAGFAFSVGRRDGATSKEEMLAYVRSIAQATDLPVSADLEEGFADDPDEVGEFIVEAAGTGIVGGSIEDRGYGREKVALGDRYSVDVAVARIQAAVDAARSLPFKFLLTARCDNYLMGHPDLDDTIRRLQAYQEAGADCLYAPGLTTKDEIRAVVSAVDRPVNVVIGLSGEPISLSELEEIGVRRVSLGSTLSRTALGSFITAARELKEHGTFGFTKDAIAYADITAMFTG
ncbi:isocitrate lyase/phosphoenolpyruvate mutase family protein [Kibdelosporangium philippinense]|uniref:Isocitrate lyase/phosphoenolpyruvate mutase family protein n=1 Tax=Kibdelosporangium philippinense TaxID=211113 RepID=A0ABS8Z0V4_9PSEU|nr:isocitrate lyase/phosphoenolpyruvate mutase family protein [Kibdelosporangium philippinense]MCE7001594.1 isocitrate lyase/phosphoenolpyruvate mutase family protein [Kibdelosporangium philippinense]